MEFALNHNSERIHATDANKQDEYICPLCRKKVVLRKGEVNIDHFAHQSKCDDTWKYDMSAWHSEWQQQFPKRNQEVVIEFNDEKHRADVMACGYVIEFQHSPITADEFNERNNFYLNYGKKSFGFLTSPMNLKTVASIATRNGQAIMIMVGNSNGVIPSVSYKTTCHRETRMLSYSFNSPIRNTQKEMNII